MKPIRIPNEILASIDMLNALNGGRSQTTLKVARQRDGYEVLVKRPGVEAEALQVDVTDGRLWLYQLRPVLGREDAEPDTLLPDLLGNLILPNDVNVDAISARFLGDQWRVFLPFNDLARGFQKHIEVEF